MLTPPLLLGACHNSCFVAGTRVSTPLGPRAIESLRVGDVVWSYCFVERRPVARSVIALHRAREREARLVEIEGRPPIRGVTPTHPVYSPRDGDFRPASGLVEGGTVAVFCEGAELAIATVKSVRATEVGTPTIEVFNLSVEGPEHNYFADGVLVHNKEPGSFPTCEPTEVQIDVVAVDANAGRYDVRVSIPEPSTGASDGAKDYYVHDGTDVFCDEPKQTSSSTWTCALRPLSAGEHALRVSGSAKVHGASCTFNTDLSVTVPRASADAGLPDASDGGGGSDGAASD